MSRVEVEFGSIHVFALADMKEKTANDILGAIFFREKNGQREIIYPVAPSFARFINDVLEQDSPLSSTLTIYSEIFKKYHLHVNHILLFVKDKSLQAALFIKESDCFEAERIVCSVYDAIIMAAAHSVKIFIDEEVLSKMVLEPEQKNLRERLKKMRPEDFGHFSMN